MTVSNRDFEGLSDLPIIAAFFDEARALVGNNCGFLHAGDVWWRYGQYEPELHQFRLWFEAEKLIGFGWILSGQNFELQLLPNLEDSDFDSLAREIVDWAKSVCTLGINIECIPENSRLIWVLESCGLVRDDHEYLTYGFDLSATIPNFELPTGFKVRHVLESEFEERVSVHRDAFDPSKFTLQRYARVRSMLGYNPELDLVVSTSDNEFASFCLIWLSSGIGYFEPVGTRAKFRRQGLGRAVILEGFRRLKVLGAHTAQVASGLKNRDFYESCGFRVSNQFIGYAMKLEKKLELDFEQ
jgi:ribosomal protein S18 acetylase RimI-like enzyme